LDPDLWQRLRAAYDAVMDAPEAERQPLVDGITTGDPALGRELGRLIAADPAAGFLDTPLARLGSQRLQPGAVLSNRFVLQELLGQGGMGEVWRARDQSLNADVAVKMVRVTGPGPQDLRRFTNEIHLARRISHPNVCRVYEFFEDASVAPPRAFLTMELLEGETLAARLKRVGSMPAVEALAVFRQIARGLEAAHDAGIIHRDLKPANIMLVAGSSNRQAVVMDFGLARDHVRLDSDGTTTPGTLVGTPEYMAPEQVSGGPVTPATDIYALGLILFEMLRGTRPFASSSTLDSWMRRAREGPERLSGAVPGVQARVDGVIQHCLDYEPERRPQSVKALLHGLDGAFYVPVPTDRRFWTAAAAVVLVAAAAGGVFAWNRSRSALPPTEALQWYAEAQQALAEGASVRALNTINRAIALAPGFAAAHAALAEISLELDMPSAAQEAMLRAQELAQSVRLSAGDERYLAGMQALLLRRCADAIAALEQRVSASPEADRSYRMVSAARVMERCGRLDDAQNLVLHAAAIDPRNAAAPLRTARLSASRRDFAGASAALDVAEVIFRDRNNPEGVGEVLTLRGTFELEQDQLDEAGATLAKASEVAASLGDVRQQIRTLLQRAILQRKRGELPEAERLTTAAIDLGRQRNLETLLLEGLFAAGNVNVVRNQFGTAQGLFERVLGIAETYRHEEYRARAHLALASVFVPMHDAPKATAALDVARDYYVRIGNVRNIGIADALRGQVLTMRGEYNQAIVHFEAMLAGAAGDPEQAVSARENLAWVLAGAGRYRESLDAYQAARRQRQASGRARNEVFTLLNMADVLSRMGRFDETATTIADARMGISGPEIEWRLELVEASRLLRQGRYVDALRVADAANTDPSAWRVTSRLLVGSLAAARLGMWPRSRELLARAEDKAREYGDDVMRLDVDLARAEVSVIDGTVDAAEAALKRATAMIARSSEHQHRWRWLALSDAVARRHQPATLPSPQLTRELNRLRLKWQEPAFRNWLARADVAALLRQTGWKPSEE
jgi:tetratricopeptide (TPR) repeat protein